MSFSEVPAEDRKLEYTQNLTISDGLAHNGITAILEDSRGYIWISTYDGLNRYDGYEFKTFKNTIDEKIFVSNRIRTISEDKQGVLWLGTDEGISTYNYEQEKFVNVYSNFLADKAINGPIVRKILFEHNHGQILCATEGEGILIFNSDYSFSGQYFPEADVPKERILIFDGIALDNENFLFSSSIGVLLFNIKSKQFHHILKENIRNCSSIVQVSGNILLATLSFGIAVFKYEEGEGKYTFQLDSKYLEEHEFIHSSIDPSGNLWLSTRRDGVVHVGNVEALVNKKPLNMAFFDVEKGVLRTSYIASSTTSGCWVGTFDRGIFRFDINENPFKYYNTEMDFKFGLQSNEILTISAIDDHHVYITANRGGIALFNTQKHRFEPFPFKLPRKNKLGIGGVFVDSRGNTWFRDAMIGLFKVKPGAKQPEQVKHENAPNLNNIVPRSYSEDNQGNVWIGCVDDVYKISVNKLGDISNIESLNRNPFFQNDEISLARYVYEDPMFDFIWIGTDADGLYRVKVQKNRPVEELEIKRFANDKTNRLSISSNFVTSIVRLPNGELWLGTERGGICKVINSDKDPEFVSFSEEQGLSNNVVKSILYDEEYNLWLSTNIGLNKFDTKDFRFRTFKKAERLPFEDFGYASAKLNNGLMVLSGINGFCYFNPKDLPDEEVLPKLQFGDFKIFNKIIMPGDTVRNRVLFDKHLSHNDQLVLKHNENVFSIELTSLHFSTPDNHFLKYQLLPISQDWIEVPSDQRFIYYNGLQPDEYELQVMASNSLNEWTATKVLNITITPPFWKTPLAFVLYFIVLALIILSILFYILRMNSLRHKLQIEQMEKDKVKEVNAAKLRFFSNISHEIKTPLTLISGPIDMLSDRFKANDDIKDKLHLVQRQSKKIWQLIDQVHDFQRADAKLLKMNSTRFCFDIFINELITDFKQLAINEEKIFEVNNDHSRIYVQADRYKLEMIFNNLFNNAFKHTKTNDTISIDYRSEERDLVVVVSDTGKGIDPDDLPHIFKRFYQSKKKQSAYTGGSGIGLAFSKLLVEMHYGYINAESELHKGTNISVRLPIVRPELKEDQYEKEQDILLVEKEFEADSDQNYSANPSDIEVSDEFSEARIFYVEDNSDMRLFVSELLSNFFSVESFTNGKECLQAMEDEWPDIVISDVLMPEINGFELCNQIKSDIKTSHIPIILLTACTTIEDQLHGFDEGADGYITKPFNIQHLATRTEALLRNRKQLRERFQINFPLTLEKKGDNRNAFLEKLYNLMEENLDNEDLELDSFAKELYLNRTHFYQKVKALTNHTPFELLKFYRLKKAAELLVQEQVSVNDAYMMTGFKSRTHFSKLFKEKYKVTPGKYASESAHKFS